MSTAAQVSPGYFCLHSVCYPRHRLLHEEIRYCLQCSFEVRQEDKMQCLSQFGLRTAAQEVPGAAGARRAQEKGGNELPPIGRQKTVHRAQADEPNFQRAISNQSQPDVQHDNENLCQPHPSSAPQDNHALQREEDGFINE